MNEKISKNLLESLFYYDENSGHLIHRQGKLKGKAAGYIKHQGYIQVSIDNKKYQEHRLIWIYIHGEAPKCIDHINGIKSDNRIENLRVATNQQNSLNKTITRSNSTGFKGVTRLKNGKYQSQTVFNGVSKYLGVFDNPELAHKAYVDFCKPLHGEFFNSGEIK